MMQEQVYQTAIHVFKGLKKRLLDMCAAVDQRIIDNAAVGRCPMTPAPQGCAQAEGDI